jgi:hypothetical protein
MGALSPENFGHFITASTPHPQWKKSINIQHPQYQNPKVGKNLNCNKQ